MKRKITKVFALALALCMSMTQMAFAADTTYNMVVSITGETGEDAGKTLSGTARYLTEESPLAAEVVKIIEANKNELKETFTKNYKSIVMDGLEAFANDDTWAAYVARYTGDVTGEALKEVLTTKTNTVEDALDELKVGRKYSMTYKGEYTVTIKLVEVISGGNMGGGGGGGSVEEPTGKDFTDVPKDSWYYEAVKWAAENGITSGISDNMFGVGIGCTRAQIVTFLWRAAGSPEPKSVASFDDVAADAYYAKAVAWALENGVTAGLTENEFGPDVICTRGQAVTFLWRVSGSLVTSNPNKFSDVANGDYYADAVAWAAANGITSGTSEDTFSPEVNCTREQIVTFLYKLYGQK